MPNTDDNNRERETAKKLFGSCGRVPALGGRILDEEDLLEPMEPGYAAFIFCSGCGYTLQIKKISTDKLARENNFEAPESYDDYYLECKRCILCLGDFVDVVLKKKPEHLSS